MAAPTGRKSHRPSPSAPAGAFRVRPFRPAWWAAGPHLQTLAGKLLRPGTPGPYVLRERWETPDGDFLDLDFAPEPEVPPGAGPAPLALVLHGLEGSSRRRYAMLACRVLGRRGFRAVALNFRSCSGEPNRRARAYHSGETGDLAWVLDRLAETFPGRKACAVGYSLGGNVLLKYLGERGEEALARVQAAVAVSVPYDLAAGARHLEASAMGRVYALYFLRSLRRKIVAKRALLEGRIRLDAALAAPTIREFDDLATAPLHGFRDAAQYYEVSSSARHLGDIRVPTLLLHAFDDPFLPREALPATGLDNPFLVRGFVERGGHVGFVAGSPAAPSFWAEEETARFLAELLAPEHVSP